MLITRSWEMENTKPFGKPKSKRREPTRYFFHHVNFSFLGETFKLNSTEHPLYTVTDKEGEHEIKLRVPRQTGWVSLGEFRLDRGKATVTLSDKGHKITWESPLHMELRNLFTWGKMVVNMGMGEIVVADAVKWVKKEKGTSPLQ